MQLAQDVVGQVAAGLGLTVHIDGHFGVLAAHFANEVAQAQHDGVQPFALGEFFIVDGQDEGTGAALLLRKLREVAIAGDPDHFKALGLNGLCKRTNAKPRGVLGTIVFIDDDDGKAKLHAQPQGAVACPAKKRNRREV